MRAFKKRNPFWSVSYGLEIMTISLLTNTAIQFLRWVDDALLSTSYQRMTSRTDKMSTYKSKYLTLFNVNPGTKVPQSFYFR
jgi:hypothetical protein